MTNVAHLESGLKQARRVMLDVCQPVHLHAFESLVRAYEAVQMESAIESGDVELARKKVLAARDVLALLKSA